MVEKLYEWERVTYKRETTSDLWRETNFRKSVITERFMQSKTGDCEIAFWRGIDSKVECYEDEDGWVFFNNERCDGCEKCCERFIPYEILDFGGEREKESLMQSDELNVIPILEDTKEHLIVRFGIDTKADYDLIDEKWVG